MNPLVKEIEPEFLTKSEALARAYRVADPHESFTFVKESITYSSGLRLIHSIAIFSVNFKSSQDYSHGNIYNICDKKDLLRP